MDVIRILALFLVLSYPVTHRWCVGEATTTHTHTTTTTTTTATTTTTTATTTITTPTQRVT